MRTEEKIAIDEALADLLAQHRDIADAYAELYHLKEHGVTEVYVDTLEPVIPDNVVMFNKEVH